VRDAFRLTGAPRGSLGFRVLALVGSNLCVSLRVLSVARVTCTRSVLISPLLSLATLRPPCPDPLWPHELASSPCTQIYSRLLESATSETSARMSAMENASKNCGEMIDKLTLDMNKARQAVITQELGEIVSGAAAVEDK
jgi:hypothetical protein